MDALAKEMRDLADEPIVTAPEGRALLRKGASEIERLRAAYLRNRALKAELERPMAENEDLMGYQVDLDEVRHVWVGRRDTSYLIEFTNKDGKFTHLCLSQEAGEALGYLLREHIPDPADVVKSFFKIMTVAKGEVKQDYGWVQVQPDTAPEPTSP